MRILIADDDPSSLATLEAFLSAYGYDVTCTQNGAHAFELIQQEDHRLVISDWEMPEMSGLDLCLHVRERQLAAYVYFILLTSRELGGDLVSGLAAGADDFLRKPFNPEELRVRLRAAERIASLESRDTLIFSLAKLAESRDSETGEHLERMREYCLILAEQLGKTNKYRDIVDADFVRTIYATSPLHDIGKVGIPDSILLKPGKLTENEYTVMKTHTTIGADTLAAAVRDNPKTRFYRFAQDIVMTHHERFDGKGYPNGLAGEDIPLCGRILAVADVYDALTSKRVYKPAFTHETSKGIIVGDRGTAFDPDVVDAFLAVEGTFMKVRERLNRAFSPTTVIPTLDEIKAAAALATASS